MKVEDAGEWVRLAIAATLAVGIAYRIGTHGFDVFTIPGMAAAAGIAPGTRRSELLALATTWLEARGKAGP